MTAYARPSDREQIVRMTPGQKPRGAARPALDHLCGSVAEIGDGTCVEFATSCRTGNIEITLSPETARSKKADRADLPASDGGPRTLAVGSRPRPHAAMPEATGDFCDDLHTFDAHVPETPREATIEDLMIGAGKRPQGARRVAAPLEHGGVDIRLAQIIDAWPHLPVETRVAMVALLSHDGGGEDAARGPAARRSELRPVRAKETRAKAPGDPKRRGSRTTGNPPS